MANIKEKIRGKVDSLKNNSDFTLKEQLYYASGQFGNAMNQNLLNSYTDQFLYDYMGLESGALAILKTITKGLNIFSAPVVGMLIDAGNGKGRLKKFLLASAFPLVLAEILIFLVPHGSVMVRTVWTFVFYLLFNICDSVFDTALFTLSTRMCKDPKKRKNFYTISEFAVTLGGMLPGWILPFFVDMQKGDFNREKWVFFILAVVFGLMGLATMLLSALTLKEKVMIQREVEKKTSIDIKMVFQNRPLLLLSLSQIIDSIRQVCYNSLPFFYKQTMGNYKMKSIVEMCSGALNYTGLALTPLIAKKLSPRNIIAGGYFWTGACYSLLGLIGYKHAVPVGMLIAIGGFPNAAMSTSRKIILADSTDYMEWKAYKKTGRLIRNEGMTVAFNTMCSRICQLWKDLLINAGLKLIGYKSAIIKADGSSEAAVQTPETLKGIFWLVVIPGIVGNILPGIIMLFDNFTGKRRENILKELEEIRAEVAKTEKVEADKTTESDETE